MKITIEVVPGIPPSGTVTSGSGNELPFSGWLELLRILSELVGDPPGDLSITVT